MTNRGPSSSTSRRYVDTNDFISQQLMARRHFTDAKGVEWEVFDVILRAEPNPRRLAHSQQMVATKAWLVFESARERRRLAPFPIAWEEASTEELERYLTQATKISISVKRPE